MKKIRIPQYRKHKPSGLAVVTLDGSDIYLGRYGTKDSHEKYARLLSEYLTRKGQAVPPSTMLDARRNKPNITVVEAADRYLTHSNGHHGLGERARVKIMLKCLVGMYEGELAANIGPGELRAIRRDMIGRNWSRSYVNDLVDCLQRMFKWLAAEPLIPITTYQALKVVSGLRKGEGGVRETAPVLPVDDAVVDATLLHLPEIVADMVRLQRLTGMRPAEMCQLRPCDLDRTADVWVYRPEHHKTEHRGKDRTVFIGAKAQAVLLKYLARGEDSYCFQPRESEAKRRTVRGRGKKRQISDLGDHYEVCTYRRAIHRACDKAFPHPDGDKAKAEALRRWQADHRWSPNRLRHTFATEVRSKFGLEHTQVALGHSRADVTQIYAERDMLKGAEVARQIG